MAAVRRQSVKQTHRKMMVHQKHPAVQYDKTGYRNVDHVRKCSHVKTVVTHHNICDKEKFYSILASGCSIVAALLSIGIALARLVK